MRYNLPTIPISIKAKENLERLKEAIWAICGLIRVYTSTSPNSEPIVIQNGSTILDAAVKIHKDFAEKFKFAKVWGKSVKYPGQRVGKDHLLADGDIIELNA